MGHDGEEDALAGVVSFGALAGDVYFGEHDDAEDVHFGEPEYPAGVSDVPSGQRNRLSSRSSKSVVLRKCFGKKASGFQCIFLRLGSHSVAGAGAALAAETTSTRARLGMLGTNKI